jgi:hypothetical protein
MLPIYLINALAKPTTFGDAKIVSNTASTKVNYFLTRYFNPYLFNGQGLAEKNVVEFSTTD